MAIDCNTACNSSGSKRVVCEFILALMVAFGYHFIFVLVSWFNEIPGLRSDLFLWIPNIIISITWVCTYLLNRLNSDYCKG